MAKEPVEIWLSEDKEDPVIVTVVRNKDGKQHDYSISDVAAGVSMRAYAIGLLYAKHVLDAGLLKGLPEAEILQGYVAQTPRSRKEKPQRDCINSLASLYLNTSASPPKWFADFEGRIPSTLYASGKKKRMVTVTFGRSWTVCDFRFFKINPRTKIRSEIDDPLKFAVELEQGNRKWTNTFMADQLKRMGKASKDTTVTAPKSSAVPARHTLEFYKEQFDDYLTKALKDIEEGPWWKLFQDRTNPNNKIAQLGERIGELQREKQAGRLVVKSTPIKGDIDFVLESTHEVFFSATRDYPEIGRAFDSLIDALEVINHAAASLRNLKLETLRTDWMRDIGRKFAHGRIYLFLLYFTYLEIEAPNAPRTIRSRNLLSKNHFFSLLGSHRAGINAAFPAFHDVNLFCLDGETFHNLYYQPYEVQPGDTLQSIIHKKYQNGHIDFAVCLQGLLECHDFLRGIPVTSELLPLLKPLGKTSIVIVPPGPRDNPYQTGVTEVQKWVKKRNQTKKSKQRERKPKKKPTKRKKENGTKRKRRGK